MNLRPHPDGGLTAPELKAKEIINGAILALWAIGLGVYLTAGGVQQLTSTAYRPLMRLVYNDYRVIGVSLLVAGVINVAAMFSRQRRLIAGGALLCGLWCGTVAFCMGVAMFTLPGGGNMNTWSMGLVSVIFVMRFATYRRRSGVIDDVTVIL